MTHSLAIAEIEKARALVSVALAGQADEQTRAALEASLQILNTLTTGSIKRPRRYAGSVEHTFHDEECLPYSREIDVRVYYSWSDYNPADELSSEWGAYIEEVELIAVRYFDRDGEVIPLGAHHQELASELLSAHDDRLQEVCTDDGCRKGVGEAPGWYVPAKVSAAYPVAAHFPARLAPSQSTRAADESRCRLG